MLCQQVKHGLNQEEGEAILDALWSLQYLAQEGVVCAFAGQVLPSSSLQATSLQQQHPFTHAVHFRFSTPAVRTALCNTVASMAKPSARFDLHDCLEHPCTLQLEVLTAHPL